MSYLHKIGQKVKQGVKLGLKVGAAVGVGLLGVNKVSDAARNKSKDIQEDVAKRTGVSIANLNSPEHKAMMAAYDEGLRKATPAKKEPLAWPQPLPDTADVGVVPTTTSESQKAMFSQMGFDDDFESSFDNFFN